MNEIYWLTRIGVIEEACNILFDTVTAIVTCGVLIFVVRLFFFPDISDIFEFYGVRRLKKWLDVIFAIWVISFICKVFIPSQKDMLKIYRPGTTVDYIKSNDKVKELPDKEQVHRINQQDDGDKSSKDK